MPIFLFRRQEDWAAWLDTNHGTAEDAWLRLAKKGSPIHSVSYAEALEVALCYGWIDAHKKAESEQAWLQRFTPRRNKSIWSKVNREKAVALMEAGRMKPAGLEQVERAKRDGRWDAAYDSMSGAEVPDDLQTALDGNARAQAFFRTLDRANRYAILFRIQTVKKAETRARRIREGPVDAEGRLQQSREDRTTVVGIPNCMIDVATAQHLENRRPPVGARNHRGRRNHGPIRALRPGGPAVDEGDRNHPRIAAQNAAQSRVAVRDGARKRH